MPILPKIIFLTIIIWCAVYTVSYAAFQIKNKRLIPGFTTVILTLLMLAAGVTAALIL